MHHGRAQQIDFKLGGDREGRIQALRLAHPPGRRRLPRPGRVPAQPHRADGQRRLRDPQDRDRHQGGGDQHHADRAGARRRPAGGHPDARAGDRPVRRRRLDWIRRRCVGATSSRPTRSRSRPHPGPTTTAATTAARSSWCWRRPAMNSSAKPAGAAASRRRSPPARHRDQRLRRGHQRNRRDRVRRRRDDPGRRGDRQDRVVLPGPGPRDHLRPDRRRSGSGCRSRRSRCSRATPTWWPAGPAPTARSRPRSAAPPPDRRPTSWSSWPSELVAEELEASPEDIVLDLGGGTVPRRGRARRRR